MAKHTKPASKRKYVLALALTLALSFSGTFSAMALWKDAASAPSVKVQSETFSALGISANGEEKPIFSKKDAGEKECNATALPLNSYSASGKPFKVNLDMSPKKPGYTYSVFPVDDPSKCSCSAATGKLEDIPSTAKYACVVAKVTGSTKEEDAGTYSNTVNVVGTDESSNLVEASDTWTAKLTRKSRDADAIIANVNIYRDDVRCSR